MRTLKSYIAAGATTVLLFCSVSCSKTFYTNANINPNAPANVPSSTLLSGIEVSLAYTQGGASSQFTSLFTQQTFGNQRQAQAYYTYILNPTDPEYLWDQMYTYVMENDYTLMNQAQAAGQNEYYGISNIIMAYSLQTMVDYWNSIPYSNALKGTANPLPAYDNGQALYGTILTLLNTGITYLSNSNKGILIPTVDDVIYGGNEGDWIKFAYAIEARIYIHQCKHGNVSLENSAIVAVDSSGALAGSFVNAVVNFGAASPNNAPWYQFNNQRGEYITFGGDTTAGLPTLIDTMEAMNDPRDSIFVSGLGGYSPTLGNYYGSGTSPVEFITTEELDLIAAEANVRLGNTAAAQVAYTASVNASMTKLAVPASEAAAYMGSLAPLSTTASKALDQVGIQQWIVLYLNPEAWTCWRRNNVPVLNPTAGTEVIRRMIYPNTEITLNSGNVPQGVTIFQPVIFWDN